MFFNLSEYQEVFGPLRVFQYVTVRSFGAAATAFLISMVLGPWFIRWLRKVNLGQHVRREYVEELHDTFHGDKEGTPTMGGLLIIAAVLVSTLLWARSGNRYVWMALTTMIYMGGVGFLDDWLKCRRKDSRGLRVSQKLILQSLWVALLLVVLGTWGPSAEHAQKFMVPFMKSPLIESMGWPLTFFFMYMVMVGATNAVNLTDGLDGLAVGCTGSVALAYLLMAYAAGHSGFATYLDIPHIQYSSELTVFSGALLGACLGFLWFNCYPAQLFMGDTGSLALGGSIAMVALAIKQELVLVIVGGVFVIEAMSVLIQVGSLKLRGKRAFLCSPLHHHFEMAEKKRAETEGREVRVIEPAITIRFWILSILFAILGVATLKLR